MLEHTRHCQIYFTVIVITLGTIIECMFEDIVLQCSTSVTNGVLAAATMSRTHSVDNSRQLTASAPNKDTPDPCDYDMRNNRY